MKHMRNFVDSTSATTEVSASPGAQQTRRPLNLPQTFDFWVAAIDPLIAHIEYSVEHTSLLAAVRQVCPRGQGEASPPPPSPPPPLLVLILKGVETRARDSQRQPETARDSQRQPETARESQREPERARERQRAPEPEPDIYPSTPLTRWHFPTPNSRDLKIWEASAGRRL
jgi:hypothetical protein